MQIVIPMSGKGERFKRAGYRDLKPLIEVDGMPIIQHVVGMFPGETEFTFICSSDALQSTPLQTILERVAPSGRIVEIQPHKRGPVHAVLQAADYIRRDQPVIVNYCDFCVEWDYADFKRTVESNQCDGCIPAYRGFHPHSLGPNLYAYMRHDNNFLVEIAEKHCFTDNRMQEFASAGTYYFRNGDLLLRYFQEAVTNDLSLNGEFYASLPYNLLVRDHRPVFIYELNRFLQWGTPEDLEEYVAWSRYFHEWENWKPTRATHPGTNLIPMAGAGVRFVNEGFRDPKPLVQVNGKALIEHSLDCLPSARKWVAVCQATHLADSRLASSLHRNGRQVHAMAVPALTSGQAATCLLARDAVDPELPLLIAPCDSAAIFDEDRFADLAADESIDCLVWTFLNHPHANRNPRQYGWLIADSSGQAKQVLCKEIPPTSINETPGIIGTFWFRKARHFFDAADRLISENRRVNGEFYADSCIQVGIENGLRVCIFPVEAYICLGTPDDVRTYEYWAGYFHTRLKRAGVHA